MSIYATTPYWSRVLSLVLSARFARLTWSLTPPPPAEASHRPHRPARNQAQIGLAPKMPHWRVDSGDASHLLPTSPGTIPGSRQDLPLSRTVLSNQWLPYVDPFACDWPGLRTHPVAGRAPQPQTQANHRMSIRLGSLDQQSRFPQNDRASRWRAGMLRFAHSPSWSGV